MFLLCVNKRVTVDVTSNLLCVTACMQGRDFVVARWKEWKDQGGRSGRIQTEEMRKGQRCYYSVLGTEPL